MQSQHLNSGLWLQGLCYTVSFEGIFHTVGSNICAHLQGSCSEFLGVIVDVFLRVGEFSTVGHLCVHLCDGVYGSDCILHSLIVGMQVGVNLERLGERLCFDSGE